MLKESLDEFKVSSYNNEVYVETKIRSSRSFTFFRELSDGARQQTQSPNSPWSSSGEMDLIPVVGSGNSRYRIMSALFQV